MTGQLLRRRLIVSLLTASAVSAPLIVGAGGRPAVAATRCRSGARTGTFRVPVDSQGARYAVLVHAPPGGATRQKPLLFNLHGSTQSGSAQEMSTGTDATADKHHFVVAYPDGGVPNTPVGQVTLPAGFFWNIPGVPLVGGVPVPPGSRDDVRFISDAMDTIASVLCIDRTRVYATGASGGGRMASVLACELSLRVAAVAPVMGVRAGNPDAADPSRPDPATCRPRRPVPVIAIHGEKDTVDPYGGGGEAYWGYSVPVAAARWAQLDGCLPRATEGRVTSTVALPSYTGCSAGVVVKLYHSSVGGHSWPGRPQSSPANAFGAVDMSISANEIIWQEVSRYRLAS